MVKEEAGGRRSVAGIDWRFNAWGGEEGGLYSSWLRDDAVAGHILQVGGKSAGIAICTVQKRRPKLGGRQARGALA